MLATATSAVRTDSFSKYFFECALRYGTRTAVPAISSLDGAKKKTLDMHGDGMPELQHALGG
jgi:hypothetical protein